MVEPAVCPSLLQSKLSHHENHENIRKRDLGHMGRNIEAGNVTQEKNNEDGKISSVKKYYSAGCSVIEKPN